MLKHHKSLIFKSTWALSAYELMDTIHRISLNFRSKMVWRLEEALTLGYCVFIGVQQGLIRICETGKDELSKVKLQVAMASSHFKLPPPASPVSAISYCDVITSASLMEQRNAVMERDFSSSAKLQLTIKCACIWLSSILMHQKLRFVLRNL